MSGSNVMVRLQLSVAQIQQMHNLLNQTDPREQPIDLRELGLYLEKQLNKMNARTLAPSYVKSGPRESAIQSGDAFGFTKKETQQDRNKANMELMLNDTKNYSDAEDTAKTKTVCIPGEELVLLMNVYFDYINDPRWHPHIADQIVNACDAKAKRELNYKLYGTREEQDKVVEAFKEAGRNTPKTNNPFDL